MKTNTVSSGKISRIVTYTVLTLMAVTMMLPFSWTIITSRMVNEDILKVPIDFFPSFDKLTFENYVIAFKDIKLFGYLTNSVIVAVCNIVGTLLTSSMMAYSITKIRFRGSKILYKIFLSSMMLPGMVMVVPSYMVIYELKMLNTLYALIVPGCLSVYGVFFLRAFFLGVSDRIAESARIDGANEYRIFFQICLPQIKIGLIILAINTFNGSWNSYLMPSLYLKADRVKTLVVALRDIMVHVEQLGVTMAFSFIFSIPVFVIFAFAQKYFLTGYTLAGVKQ